MKKANYDFNKLTQKAQDIITSTDLASVERVFYPMSTDEVNEYAEECYDEIFNED